MGRDLQNRGRIGIQPYPVKDLGLQGYVPKTLYVPDDIGINASIVLGQYKDETRTFKTDDNGNVYIYNPPGSGGYKYKIILDSFNLNQLTATIFEYRIHSNNLFTLSFIGGITDISDNTAVVTIQFDTELPSGTLLNITTASPIPHTPDNTKLQLDYIAYTALADDVVLTFESDKVLTDLRIGAVLALQS